MHVKYFHANRIVPKKDHNACVHAAVRDVVFSFRVIDLLEPV